MKIRYGTELDSLYVELRPVEPGTVECRELMPDINADYGPDRKLASLKILDASVVLGDQSRQSRVGTGSGLFPGHGLIDAGCGSTPNRWE